MNCLKYAYYNGCELEHYTCSNAAENGHLDCLIFAHTHGCEWTDETCSNAAKNGHLDCLEYAHKNGCPIKKKYALRYAEENDHTNCITYINSIV